MGYLLGGRPAELKGRKLGRLPTGWAQICHKDERIRRAARRPGRPWRGGHLNTLYALTPGESSRSAPKGTVIANTAMRVTEGGFAVDHGQPGVPVNLGRKSCRRLAGQHRYVLRNLGRGTDLGPATPGERAGPRRPSITASPKASRPVTVPAKLSPKRALMVSSRVALLGKGEAPAEH